GPSEIGVHPTHSEWEGQTFDHPRHHKIALMCDNIETTVAELRVQGAQFRGPVEQREYGRVIMMAVPGSADIPGYEPTHQLGYNLQGLSSLSQPRKDFIDRLTRVSLAAARARGGGCARMRFCSRGFAHGDCPSFGDSWRG